MRRSRGRIVLAVLFTLLGLNAWVQVLRALVGLAGDPPMLIVLQLLIGAAAAATAAGSWAGARWAPTAALLYGLVTAGMLVALEPLLGLGPDARRGLWISAAAAMLLGLGAAWYLRGVRRSRP